MSELTSGGSRVRPLVSAICVTMGRDSLPDAVRSVLDQDYRPIEIVVYANGGRLDVLELPTAHDVPMREGGSPRNLGVAGGRNGAARLATGDHLLFVDDDAVLAPGAVSAAVTAMEGGPRIGAVAFRVVDPVTRAPALWYHPYDPARYAEVSFDASAVVGCGHAIRRCVFEELGGFWDGYFREVEEIDLSWRLLDAGWTIRYEPLAVVEHPERTARHLRASVTSNLLMVWRLLPRWLAVRQTVLKLLIFSARAVRHREVDDLALGLLDAVTASRRVRRERSPLSTSTVEYLRHVHAPQGFGKRLQWSLRSLAAPPLSGSAQASPGQPGAASRRA